MKKITIIFAVKCSNIIMISEKNEHFEILLNFAAKSKSAKIRVEWTDPFWIQKIRLAKGEAQQKFKNFEK